MLPSPGCQSGFQTMSDLSYNDDLATYLLVYVCESGPAGTAAWYYATATSLSLIAFWRPLRKLHGGRGAAADPRIDVR